MAAKLIRAHARVASGLQETVDGRAHQHLRSEHGQRGSLHRARRRTDALLDPARRSLTRVRRTLRGLRDRRGSGPVAEVSDGGHGVQRRRLRGCGAARGVFLTLRLARLTAPTRFAVTILLFPNVRNRERGGEHLLPELRQTADDVRRIRRARGRGRVIRRGRLRARSTGRGHRVVVESRILVVESRVLVVASQCRAVDDEVRHDVLARGAHFSPPLAEALRGNSSSTRPPTSVAIAFASEGVA